MFTPSYFSEGIKYFPLFCVCILCIFYILFKKNSKKFYFCFFSAKFAGYVNNTLKNLYTKFYFFVVSASLLLLDCCQVEIMVITYANLFNF